MHLLPTLDYNLPEPKWSTIVQPNLLEGIKTLLEQAFSLFTPINVELPVNLSLLFTDNHTSQQLNGQYRHKNAPTNILSFPLTSLSLMQDNLADILPTAREQPIILGDLVLAYDVCCQEAHDSNICDVITSGAFDLTQGYVLRLCAHGILHLLGLDHLQEEEALHMEAMERLILSALDIQIDNS